MINLETDKTIVPQPKVKNFINNKRSKNAFKERKMNETYKKVGISPYGAVPNENQMEWYKRERTIFFHFGMNTFTGKEWGDGTESPKDFNPSQLCVEQWIRTIKEAGFGMAILTAKHHDGFCLWQTKYTEHSVKNSPYKNGKGDIVKEFTDACQKYGIKAGIYLSPWDRHEKSWGKEEYNDFYVGQLEELLTNYGDIYECWWDGAGSTEAVYDWERWAKTVKSLQPKAVIFGSLGATPWVDVRWVGNEKGIAGKPCYATIDEHALIVEDTKELNVGKLGGERFIPAEVDVSIRPGWFYHPEQDNMVRSPQNLIDLWFSSNGSNAGLLLNLPPDKRGLIHENDAKSIIEFNNILKKALNVNLAERSTITADSERDGAYAKYLLERGKFYSPVGKKATIFVCLDKEKEFNTFIIGEEISLGHKVNYIKVSAFEENEYKTLFEREMVGYKLAERFDAIRTDKLKIEISALDTPALRDFGLYLFDTKDVEQVKVTDKNLIDLPSCHVEYKGKEIDVNLGGIFPFNSVKLTGVGKTEYKFFVFNGTSFDLRKSGKSENGEIDISMKAPIDNAYRFMLSFDKQVEKNIKIKVL